MRYYFDLQYLRLKRWITEIGIHPALGILIGLILFFVVSILLFLKTEFAAPIYLVILGSILFNAGSKQRIDFIKRIYDKQTTRKIRFIENLIFSTPFAIYLMYEKSFLYLLGIVPLVIVLAIFNRSKQLSTVIPTPFKRIPFENIQGFRISFPLLIIDYFIIAKAIQVDNYNLAAATMGSMFFLFMSFHLKPEKHFFVWIFNENSNGFLKMKLKQALTSASIIIIPALVLISIFFPGMLLFNFLIMLLGYIYLSSMIFAKYSAYPKEMNIPQAFLYVLSIIFPVILIFIFPIFYERSKSNLKPILR